MTVVYQANGMGDGQSPPSELQQLEARIAAIRDERTTIFRQVTPLNARLLALYEEMKPLEERAAVLRLEAMGDNPDWAAIIKDLASDRSSQALLRYAEKHLRERFHMGHFGYWVETNEACLKVMVPKKVKARNSRERIAVEAAISSVRREKWAKTIAGLKFFAQLYTPHKNGWVRFGVFEHTLSESGSYELLVKPDLSLFELVFTRYSRQQSIKSFQTAEEAVEYIAENHWYGDDDDED